MKHQLIFSFLLIPALISAPVSAQVSVIEEVVVTAQKREQSILDIPFAISAFSEDEIRNRGAADIKDLQYSIPGLSITSNNPGQDRVQIRGASSDTGLGLPTVGRYLDEVSLSSDSTQRALDVPLLDIGRVEVLRGPQGTLYGASSIGGIIKYITNSPDLTETSGSLGVGINTLKDGDEGFELNGVINIPIIEDKLAIRVAASTEDIAGWIDNTVTGESDINKIDRDFVRTKILFQPSDTFDASLMWMHYDLHQDNSSRERSVSGLDLLNDNRRASDERTVDVPFETPIDDKWDLVNLILNLQLENVDVISSTGYLNRDIDFHAETVNAFFPPGLFGSFTRDDLDSEIFTQEIRLSSNWDNPINYTVGAFYRTSDTSGTDTLAFPAVFGAPPTIITGNNPVDSDSWALFGEVSYRFTDAITASVGLRYFEDDQEPLLLVLGGPTPIDQSPPGQSFDALTPRFNILWNVSEQASLYGTISKGFRSGGINGFGSTIPDFEPEEALVYEIGGRGEFFDGRVFLDGAVYYSDYDDIQVSVLDLAFGRIRTTNGDSASGIGVDLAAKIKLTDDLTLDLTGGYVGREYDADSDTIAKGDSSQYTPEFTFSGALAYDFQWFGGLGGMARLSLSHADEFSVYNRAFPPQPVIETDPLTYLGFRIGVVEEKWQVMLSAENLLNEKDEVFPGGAFALATYSRPTSVSIETRYDF